MSELATMVHQAIGQRSVREAAQLCGLKGWTLEQIIYGRSQRPHPNILRAIERGLGIPYEKLALAAYGINGSDTPPGGDEARPPANGRRSRKTTASVS